MHVKLLSSKAFLQPKMEQISFSGRALPESAWGAYGAPQTPIAGLRGHLAYHTRALALQSAVKTWLQNVTNVLGMTLPGPILDELTTWTESAFQKKSHKNIARTFCARE